MIFVNHSHLRRNYYYSIRVLRVQHWHASRAQREYWIVPVSSQGLTRKIDLPRSNSYLQMVQILRRYWPWPESSDRERMFMSSTSKGTGLLIRAEKKNGRGAQKTEARFAKVKVQSSVLREQPLCTVTWEFIRLTENEIECRGCAGGSISKYIPNKGRRT